MWGAQNIKRLARKISYFSGLRAARTAMGIGPGL
jgi:hypothetical protein